MNKIAEFNDLVGKTIVSAKPKKLKDYDDSGYLELKFSDGASIIVVGGYGGWTGSSEDEYPTRIGLSEIGEQNLIGYIDDF